MMRVRYAGCKGGRLLFEVRVPAKSWRRVGDLGLGRWARRRLGGLDSLFCQSQWREGEKENSKACDDERRSGE